MKKCIISEVGWGNIPFIRNLKKNNVPVFGILNSKKNPFYYTNACEKIMYEHDRDEKFISFLVDLAKKDNEKSVLIPVGDFDALLFAEHREVLLEHYYLNVSNKETVNIVLDKNEFYNWGKDKYDFPKTFIIKTLDDLLEGLSNLDYAIIKPKYRDASWRKRRLPKGLASKKKKEIINFFLSTKDICDTFILSEFIEGPDSNLFTCHVYYSDGKLFFAHTNRKIRQYPPVIGNGSYVVGNIDKEINEKLKKTTTDILDNLSFSGIGGIEFKRDDKGNFKIIEGFSCRPSSHFSTAVDFPYLVYSHIAGMKLPKINKFTNYWYDLDDLKTIWIHLKNGKFSVLFELIKTLFSSKICVFFSFKDLKLLMKKLRA